MTLDSAASGPPGWFGKIPALGDFAARRLPRRFVDRWDEWLASELRDARIDLGAAWGTQWDAAPTACFVHAAGTLDDLGWHGIVMPSADRVGRRYPLTIAQCGAIPFDGDEVRRHWHLLVHAARATRDAQVGIAQLEALLAAIAPWPSATASETRNCRWGLWCDATSDVENAGVSTALPRAADFRRLIGAAR